ncbi:MAG: T9SS type A sorting domain-containing protein [Flavobacteriales bacterium]|nr:T9SS type A sorting domain-containing protein [Flavobacteriales bacterium]
MKKTFLLLIAGLPFCSLAQWTQLGMDIDGDGTNDQSAWSVACSDDGNRIVVGARANDDGGPDAGQVKVYDYVGGSWIQIGSDINGLEGYENCGTSVDISADGNRIAVSSRWNDTGGENAGLVRVFDLVSGDWMQIGSSIVGDEEDDYLGWSLALSKDGNRLVAGAPGSDDVYSAGGEVKVFELEMGDWVQLGADIPSFGLNSSMGLYVDINADGSRVVASAPEYSGGGTFAGLVSIYEYSAGSWVQMGTEIVGASIDDNYGTCIAMNDAGDVIAIGSPGDDDGGLNAGAVHVFEYDGSDWVQKGDDIVGEMADEKAGFGVDLNSDGTVLAVGAATNTLGGVVRVYQNLSSDWVQIDDDIVGEVSGDLFGYDVALNLNGGRLVVGAPNNDEIASNAGVVEVYWNCITSVNSIVENACDSYTVPSGDETYTSSGIYTDTISSACGADSILTIDLTIPEINVDVIIGGLGVTLEATNFDGTYQWIDCHDYSIIEGATGLNFAPADNGSYAVIITEDECSDTSECMTISQIGIEELASEFKAYPNPTNGKVTVELGEVADELNIKVFDAVGAVVMQKELKNAKEFDFELPMKSGLYILEITKNDFTERIQLIKQ